MTRDFQAAARQALGDEAREHTVRHLARHIETADDYLRKIRRETDGILEKLTKGSVDMWAADPGEPEDPEQAFSALGQLDHPGYSGTIGSNYERALYAAGQVRAMLEGYRHARIEAKGADSE